MYDLLVITGPTATGKNALGAEAALAFGGEVVSADSMQVYRRMDIGTAKPTEAERRGVPHHMLDVAEPEEPFSAAKYADMAAACVEDIRRRGRLPIVVGGTGLYIDGLLRGDGYAPAPAEPGLRAELEAEYDRAGGEAFRESLRAVDPQRAALLAPGDRKRLVRAMEVYRLTGETITAHDERSKAAPPRYSALKLALDFRERQTLYDRIDRRAEAMFEAGLAREVQALLDSGVPLDATSMQAIGYKEVAAWLRHDDSIRWIRWENEPDIGTVRRISTVFSARTP